MQRTSRRAGRALIQAVASAALFVGLLVPVPAAAQYFGRNQVRYKDFDFQVLESQHFDVYNYQREAGSADIATQMAERWYTRFASLMNHELTGRQPFILYADHSDFEQTTAISGRIGQGTGGVTEPLNRRVVLPMAGPLGDTDHVIGHELVHAFQYDMGGVTPGSPRYGAPTISGLPLWLVEGMAEYMSIGPESSETAMWMRDALIRDEGLPSLSDLRNSQKYFPYRYGHAFLAYIGGRWGDSAVVAILRESLGEGSPRGAIADVTGMPADSVVAAWHQALKDTYGPIQDRTGSPEDFAQPLTDPDDDIDLNVGPALSPDGSRLLFLSTKDRLSIDLYLADAATGKVIRRVTRSALDPHYSSLQFINSAGTFSPDGREFVFAAVQAGVPILSVMETETGERVKDLRFPELGAVFNPTWSPDGKEIAFVANQGGVLDLWIVTVATGQTRRLTDSPYAELHPDWSPDGSRLVISTDRFTTDMSDLETGNFRLATVDVATGDIQPLTSFRDARNINPRWGPDGRTLFFIADPGGIPNVYRLDAGSDQPVALTNLYVGASGITGDSPALAVARQSGRLVFTAYRNGAYELFRIDDAMNAPAAVSTDEPVDGQTLLPPQERQDLRLIQLLRRPDLGLPDTTTFTSHPYRAGLSLDYIAQPSLGFGISSYGSFIGGGAAFLFSDMLGYHELLAQLQVSVVDGHVLDGIGLIGQYVNRSHRLAWGVIAGQMPQIGQGIQGGITDINNDGQQELVQQTLTFWQVSRQAKGLVMYPFSPTVRLEFTGGFERTDYNIETKQRVFSTSTGQLQDEQTFSPPACGDSLSLRTTLCEPAPLNEAVATAALVQDNSLVGPTGPLAGQRYRLEISPSFGTLQYTSALADYRRYIQVLSPLTLAGRAMHYGRYGRDARDDRLARIFLGYPALIRGYDRGSFDPSVCPANQALSDCSEAKVLGELFGSRVAVANAEARLSIFGPLGVAGSSFLPMDLIGFYDAGVAWTADQKARFLDKNGTRDILRSAGVGLRLNLMGFFLGEVDWVYPFDRPDKGGYVTFSINSGF